MKKASAQRQRAWRSQTVSLEAFLPRFDVEGGLEPPGAEWPELGSALAEQVNVAGFLRKALDDMDEGIRAAFVLCELAELTAEDAAAIVETSPEVVRREVQKALESFGSGSGHVFNLGHGVPQLTPPENVAALVAAVRELSPKFH